MNDITLRTCSKCGESLPGTTKFFHRGSGKGGLRANCRDCQIQRVADNEHRDPAKQSGEKKRYHEKLRSDTLRAYCGDSPQCHCCGEATVEFLTLDHVANDGNVHRKEIGVGGQRLYRWARDNNYPDSLQVLCRNCNWGKHAFGVCPHQKN